MIIEKIVFNKKQQSYTVYFDSLSPVELTEDTLVRYNLYKSMELDAESLPEILRDNEKYLALKALRRFLLNRKTIKEARDHLQHKGFSLEVAEDALSYLIDNGYLNDAAYARDFVYDKVHINHYGPNKIRMALRQKGIPQSIADQALASLDSDASNENLRKFAARKYNALKPSDPNRYGKTVNYLLYKGFSYEAIKKVLGEFCE
ncbi:regulatory protein RecX [Peptoniphilus equinus]|uniref:Regulatory protein RecX n=1 Tax=Peptoniphilus equinus TaxID=3016343 RepID=A0ABY7QSV5_9FIRM|nr:regulatory protein RecX [Peptoniphilus equinus]WBW49238.1 regulatory protein RecX [Peptoniphilus equinus]